MLSDRVHVIFPWHFAEDRAMDRNTSDGENIGTTGAASGPVIAIKWADRMPCDWATCIATRSTTKFDTSLPKRTVCSRRCFPPTSIARLDADAIFQQYSAFAERLKPFVADTTEYLLSAAENGKRILFEGAEGALLDVDHGTYPFVTSSNSSGVGVSNGSGVPGKYIDKVIGIVKAYTTRVGGGPFPTEQDNAIGQRIRDSGNEYGTVTKRPRRCGWLDTVAVRYTRRLSGVDSICIMLLDVLSGFDELQICTAYEIDGRRTNVFPSHVDDIRKVKPIYESVPGWQEDISAARSLDDLPAAARDYLDRISELVGVPVEMVSVGPDRNQTIPVRTTRPLTATH